jgi:hypothetical protein
MAAEMDQEAKCWLKNGKGECHRLAFIHITGRKKFTKKLMRKRRHERTLHRPKPTHQLSNVEEEEDEEVWDG